MFATEEFAHDFTIHTSDQSWIPAHKFVLDMAMSNRAHHWPGDEIKFRLNEGSVKIYVALVEHSYGHLLPFVEWPKLSTVPRLKDGCIPFACEVYRASIEVCQFVRDSKRHD